MPDYKTSSFDYERLWSEINNIVIKLGKIIDYKDEEDFSIIDIQISGLMHQMSYFTLLIQRFYPLEKTYDELKKNFRNTNSDEANESQVKTIDLMGRKAFLILNLFSFETLLKIIAKEYMIQLDQQNITKKYLAVIDHFGIAREEYEHLIKIMHYTRNCAHNGYLVKEDSEELLYKGKEFTFLKTAKIIESADWFNLVYFTSEIVGIFEKIYKTTEFKKKN